MHSMRTAPSHAGASTSVAEGVPSVGGVGGDVGDGGGRGRRGGRGARGRGRGAGEEGAVEASAGRGGQERGGRAGGRVVSLFSRDVIGDEYAASRRENETARWRREEGERGRMVGYDGDLDRGQGGAVRAGRGRGRGCLGGSGC